MDRKRFPEKADPLKPAEADEGAAVLAAEETHQGGEADTENLGRDALERVARLVAATATDLAR